MVRMPCIAPHDALQRLETVTVPLHSAARAVNECNDAIDIREVGKLAGTERVSDTACRRCRTVHRSHDCDEIAGAGAAVVTAISHERIACLLRHHVGRAQVGAELVVHVRVAELGVVRMHMVSRCNLPGGVADDLRVFADFVTLRDRACCHLVTRRDRCRDLGAFDDRAGVKLPGRRDYVVGGVQPDI